MGRQIGFNFDAVDEELVFVTLEKFGTWLAWPLHPAVKPHAAALRAHAKIRAPVLAIFPDYSEKTLRAALKWNDNRPPTLYVEPASRAKLLEWTLTETVDGRTIMGEGRLFLGMNRPEDVDATVQKALRAVTLSIQRGSPFILDAEGPPRYVGRHLAERAQRGELELVWRSGKPLRLLGNPRFSANS